MPTLTVGSTKTYATPSAANAAAGNGDIIEIDPETYTDDNVTWNQNNLTLRGMPAADGTRPKLVCTADIANGKGIWVQNGTNLTIENIEGSGAQVHSDFGANGAVVRANTGVADCTLRNVYFHNSQQGFMGGTTTCTIEDSEFAFNGAGDGQTHNVYINDPDVTLHWKNNRSHHCNAGHLLKTRAAVGYIEYSRLVDGDGAGNNSSYLIDIPDGGLYYVKGCSLEKSANSENGTCLISFGAESLSNPVNKLYVVSNTMVNDFGAGLTAYVHNESGAAPAVLTNNRLVGNDAEVEGDWTDGGGNVQTTAAAAFFRGLAGFDFRLCVNDPGVNAGVAPGTGNGYDLTPAFEFDIVNRSSARPSYAPIDSGAFEFGNPVPSWVASLAVGQWYQVPGTNLNSVNPNPAWTGDGGPWGKHDAWNSYVVDVRTSKVYSVGNGGHTDYGGNEVDALSLETETPGWAEVRAQTTEANVDENQDYNTFDDSPTSVHSYYGRTLDEWNDRIMMFGGARYVNGSGTNRISSFDIGEGEYSPSVLHGSATGSMGGSSATFTVNPTTGDVYGCATNVLGKWTRSTNTYANLSPTGTVPDAFYAMSAFDTRRNRCFFLGGVGALHHIYTLATNVIETVDLSGANEGNVDDLTQGGMFYAPHLDVFLVRASGSGGTVYQVNASTFEVTTFSTTDGSGISAFFGAGPFNQFLYVPRLGGVVYSPEEYDEDVWFLKLFDAAPESEGGGDPVHTLRPAMMM